MSTIQSIHIAVISQKYSDVSERIINPTETDVYPATGSIPASVFKSLFFPSISGVYAPVSVNNLTGTPTEIQGYKDILSLGDPKTISNNELLLSEIVLTQIEKPPIVTGTTTDGGLGVTRDMLTPCSLIALINSLQSLKYFSNLGAFTCALTWDEIETTVKSLAPVVVSTYSVLLKITVLLAPISVSSIITPVALEYKFNVEFPV